MTTLHLQPDSDRLSETKRVKYLFRLLTWRNSFISTRRPTVKLMRPLRCVWNWLSRWRDCRGWLMRYWMGRGSWMISIENWRLETGRLLSWGTSWSRMKGNKSGTGIWLLSWRGSIGSCRRHVGRIRITLLLRFWAWVVRKRVIWMFQWRNWKKVAALRSNLNQR